ncbi:hypothetical protein PWEIH_03711 [Listeria weihenstephanensis FSL R9-0317]|uniref:Uncharacterized protein n=1 Tax=Listeria weihenstephanensis TaxID=1006155 RepID=A0A1S7FS22_9LIST|nr:hypothetical protein [Listeria weihenstephanensis]AQY50248.1 hypothetical protein UE46_03830 [Listeria weihenstephanensis]EUJ40501.1 hypothetical protein PWEIH_03711 [Listeria weihenstephanensis FSL R9-0317]
MYKIFSFVTFTLGLAGIFLLQVLDMAFKNYTQGLLHYDSENYSNINYFGAPLVIPVIFIVMSVIFAFLAFFESRK